MKPFIFLFIAPLAVCQPVFAQTDTSIFPLNENGRIEFSEVITVDSASATALYSKANNYVAHAFTSAKNVTELADPESKTLIVKARLPRFYTNPFNSSMGGAVNFTMQIQCKDGRYKYTVTDLVHQDAAVADGGPLEAEKPACKMGLTKRAWRKLKVDTKSQVETMVKSLKESMKPKAADEW